MGNSKSQRPEENREVVAEQIEPPEVTINIAIIGNSGVGKTAIPLRFKQGTFVEPPLTIGTDWIEIDYRIDGKRVRFRLRDTHGMERFRSLNWSFFHQLDVILITFDVSNRESFDHIVSIWYQQGSKSSNPRTCIAFVGNKTDLPHMVTSDELEATAAPLGCASIMCSAKDGTNIEELFKLCYVKGLEKQEADRLCYATNNNGTA